MDATSAVLNANCGISNDYIINKINTQMKKIMNFDLTRFSTVPIIEFAEKLASLLPPSLSRSFFCCSGSEAVETAYKMAVTYALLTGKRDNKVISIKNAYHGTTLCASELSHSSYIKGYGIELQDRFYSINVPHCEDCFTMKRHDICNLPDDNELEEKVLELGPQNVAAVFIEPVMGIGGYIFLPDAFLEHVKEVCLKYDILLVYDETMTSFGRTGKMFAFEHNHVVPDILITGKGISSGYFPFSSITTSDRIYNEFEKDEYLQGFRHGHTNSGHSLGAAAGLATIEYIMNNNLVYNSQEMGTYIKNILEDELIRFDFIKMLRGKGLLVAFNVMDSQLCERILEKTLHNGLIVRETNGVIALLPALTIDKPTCDMLIERLLKSLREV